MAGQGRTLFALGGVLVAGVAAAVWFAMDESSGPAPDETTETADAAAGGSEASGKPSAAPNRRPKKAGTASVVGEVRRSKGKVPVADQEVQLFPEKGEPWTARTDASGAFQLKELPHGGPYELRITAPKCGTIHVPGLALDRNERRDVGTLWLDPSVKVGVTVKGWADQPVEGALVEAFAVVQADNFDWSKAYAQMGATPVAVTKATTDAEGKAVFPELATGRWTFTASKEGFSRAGRSSVSIRSDVEPPAVKLYLGTGHALAGRVLDAAKAPVPGAILLAGPQSNAWDLGSAPLRSRTTTDAEGRYSFSALEAGDTALLVGRPGGVPSVVATLRIPSVKQFDVVLKGTATVTGTVTEKDGAKPIEGATVRGWSWSMQGSNVAEGTTDAQGKYTITVVEGQVGSLVAEKDGWVSADEPGRQAPQMQLREGESQSRDLKLRPGAKVSGTVKGPDGPLPGAKVWAHSGSPNTGWTQKSATTDAEGHYEVGSLAPGKVLVRADLAGYYVKDFPEQFWMLMQTQGPSPFKVDLAEGGSATKDLEMVRGVAVEGRVEGPDGPLAGVRVASQTDWEGGVVTTETGTFKIEGVKPSATAMLFAVKEGFAPSAANKTFTVTADKPTTDVVLRMVRVGTVKGTVTTSDGGPLKDAQIRVVAWQDRNEQQWNRGYYDPNALGAASPVRPDGSYEIPLGGVPTGKFRVTVSALDRPSTSSEPQSINEGQAEYVVNLTVDAGKDLEGRVVVKPGGAPVAGANVTIQPRGNARGNEMMYGGMRYGGDGGQAVWAVTDADGRFTVSHLAPGGYGVSAAARGYVGGSASADLAAVNQVTVEIEQELSIDGTVKLPDGAPVEGAPVSAQREVASDPNAANQPGGNSGTTTGSGGRFRVTGLASGSFRLTVSPDWQGDLNIRTKRTDPITAGSADVKIVVDVGGVIAGRVLDPQKKGMPGLWLYANPEPKDGKPVEGADNRNVRTREDGSFSLGGLTDATTYQVTVQANQGWDMNGGASLKSASLKGVVVGTKNLEIVLEEGLTITGTVVDADGKPVPNAYLQAMSTNRETKGTTNRNAMTDEKGAFTVGGLEPGDCAISMMEWGGPSGSLVIQNGEKIAAGSKDVQLVASKGLTITGSVVDEAGAAVKNASVNASAKVGGKNRGARVKDDGTYEITGLAAGATYKVIAQAQGRVLGKQDDVAAGSPNVRLVLAKGLDASGRVLDEAGNPVKQGSLMLTLGTDNDYRAYAATDNDGNFKISGLLNETYEATCYTRTAQNKGYRKCGVVKAGDSGVTLNIVADAK